MPRPPSPIPDAIPRWLIIVISATILFHLTGIASAALAAPSGPWPTMQGRDMFTPPQFAWQLNNWMNRNYLQFVKLTSNYHFGSNQPGLPGVFFEARLKDESGQEIARLKFPDPRANFWVRHRQSLLAMPLGNDQPVIPPQAEAVPAPNQKAPTAQFWDGNPPNFQLKTVPQHLIPRDRQMVMGPADFTMLLVRSYSRHLCRAHGAASVELIRHHADAIPPAVLFPENVPVQAGAFDDQTSNFGDMKP